MLLTFGDMVCSADLDPFQMRDFYYLTSPRRLGQFTVNEFDRLRLV